MGTARENESMGPPTRNAPVAIAERSLTRADHRFMHGYAIMNGMQQRRDWGGTAAPLALARKTRRYNNMEKGDIFSVVLCVINILFMVVGIFLNSVVIISIWRSRQLRKKLCYFMIIVLSCVDLAVITISHPFLIASTIYYSLEELNDIRERERQFICFILYGVSMFALFSLNIERFLTSPCFHQASVIKTRLVYFQTLVTIIV